MIALVSANANARDYDTYVEWPSAVSLGYQGSPTLGLGLLTAGAYERHRGSFIDGTVYVELLFAEPTLVAPTAIMDSAFLSLFPDWIYLDVGASVSTPTDFQRIAVVAGPRVGLATEYGVVRLIYSYNAAIAGDRFTQQDRHKVMLELNLTTIYTMRIGL